MTGGLPHHNIFFFLKQSLSFFWQKAFASNHLTDFHKASSTKVVPSLQEAPAVSNMQSSSVLIVHPPADSRFRLPDMANGKLLGGSNARHYSLDSPSLTSPPGYHGISTEPILPNMPLSSMSMSMSMVDQKPPHFAMSTPMNVPSTSAMPIHSSHQFPSFNHAAGLVMAPAPPPGLLQLSKSLDLLQKAQKL